jgi:hypothetical protein
MPNTKLQFDLHYILWRFFIDIEAWLPYTLVLRKQILIKNRCGAGAVPKARQHEDASNSRIFTLNVVQDPGPYREKPAKEEVQEPAPKPCSARASTLASGYYGQQ